MRKVREERPPVGVFAQKLISGHPSRCEWWEADHQFYSNYILMN